MLLYKLGKSCESSGSFGMNIAILEKADCPGGAVFSDQVMAIFETNDPLLVILNLSAEE